MARNRLAIVIFGLVVVLAGLGAVLKMQSAVAQAQPGSGKGHGYFGIQIDASGKLICRRGGSSDMCKPLTVPPELKNATIHTIVVIKTNPCYINHNGEYREVPCD